MSSATTSFPLTVAGPDPAPARVPWTVWAGVLAVTSSSIGGSWDVAWHRSIGRDSFLTPAHIAIYACGVIAAVVCSDDHRQVRRAQIAVRQCAWLSRTAWRLHRGLGRHRDAHLRTL